MGDQRLEVRHQHRNSAIIINQLPSDILCDICCLLHLFNIYSDASIRENSSLVEARGHRLLPYVWICPKARKFTYFEGDSPRHDSNSEELQLNCACNRMQCFALCLAQMTVQRLSSNPEVGQIQSRPTFPTLSPKAPSHLALPYNDLVSTDEESRSTLQACQL